MLENTKPGNKSTEFWLSAGIIIVVMIVATILLLVGIIKEDNWTKIVLYVCGIVGAAYTAGRSVVKTFASTPTMTMKTKGMEITKPVDTPQGEP